MGTKRNKKGINILEQVQKILYNLKDYINSSDFINMAKENNTDFIRTRLLPFVRVIMFIINFRSKSTQAELNQFFENIYKGETIPKKCSFFKARLKIKAEGIQLLLEKASEFFYHQEKLVKRWKGFRVVAVDGSIITIPVSGDKIKDEKLIRYFGEAKNDKQETKVIQGHATILYDVLNNMIISGFLSSYPANERSNLIKLIDKLQPNDLLLLDRGYSAAWLFKLLNSKNIKYICRIQKNFTEKTDAFFNSKEKEKIITLNITKESIKKYKGLKLKRGKIKVRLIKVKLADGSIEVIASSLLNKDKYSHKLFKDMYFRRWGIEGLISTIKNKLKLEYFSGKSVKVILQDFYAKLLQKNLYTLINLPTEIEIKKETKNLKHKYKANENIGYSVLKNKIVKIFIWPIEKCIELIKYLIKGIKEQIEPVRKNRKYPRHKKICGKSITIAFSKRMAI